MRTRTILTSVGLAAVVAGSVAGVGSAVAAAPSVVPGGTNYNWFKLDGCDREPYGVVRNYDEQKTTIDTQLQAIYAGGQRRLSIGIFHISGASDGTLMNSAGGKLTVHDRKNLTDLLAEMKQIGFPEVVLTMNPQGKNLPTNTNYDPGTYAENLSFLEDVRSVAVASGEPYTIDLYDEGIPEDDANNPTQVAALYYSKKLWTDYTTAFGKADTTGFSIIGGDPLRFASLAKVYGTNPPTAMNLHFYGPPNFTNSEHDQFVAAHNALHAAGFDQPWIIGETYYNDATAAAGIRTAMTETGQPVLWVTDWQLSRAKRCDQVDVVPPTDYSAFAAQGFDPFPSGTPDATTTPSDTSGVVDVPASDKPGAADLPLDRNSVVVQDPATQAWNTVVTTKQGTMRVPAATADARPASTRATSPGELQFTPAKASPAQRHRSSTGPPSASTPAGTLGTGFAWSIRAFGNRAGLS